MKRMKTAIYPGSFDPVTSGHLNIIRRAASIFDKLIVCVMVNAGKNPMFTLNERVELIRRVTKDLPNVEIDCSSELLKRIPDGYGQSQAESGSGHHVPDCRTSVHLSQLQHGEGTGILRSGSGRVFAVRNYSGCENENWK